MSETRAFILLYICWLCRRIPLLEAEYGFRVLPRYNNFMMSLTGRVAEKLGGASFEQLMKSEVFAPLGISPVFLHEQAPNYENIAVPYVRNDGKLQPVDRVFHRSQHIHCTCTC